MAVGRRKRLGDLVARPVFLHVLGGVRASCPLGSCVWRGAFVRVRTGRIDRRVALHRPGRTSVTGRLVVGARAHWRRRTLGGLLPSLGMARLRWSRLLVLLIGRLWPARGLPALGLRHAGHVVSRLSLLLARRRTIGATVLVLLVR